MTASLLEIKVDGWASTVRCLPSPNFDARPDGMPIDLLVIHNISLPPSQFGGDWIDDLFLNRLDPLAHPYFEAIHTFKVSSHFLIKRDGGVTQYVSCNDRAWHAGASCWRDRTRCNDFAIGIELEGDDFSPFANAQYASLGVLTDAIRKRYPSIQGVAGHSEISPGRKTDPGDHFDWLRYISESQIQKSWRTK
ncbi:1,6-anhydro-N-acetylmuramyl-L-alanine amidase AmpD [Ephemeroptericola cinctiostellae]|uniref:1,6-anhydro-N-acetylmuramyl-L-alanine amidase AmpD n=1 Tax=Ephemeroptericola cinctiostellae TaxID=2268024 RepID=A0A345D966_9BURK|nr:1,6-anhydro-N-acetylmuramyl-L-alanine amidase AmpD [Ephemeroptericola cinctiostellae]AXF84904.1 1,6-anhydro-N-acetylmuramyl-L-alanine amidase AmpD [Ephemeroptericola cinctiostellae]